MKNSVSINKFVSNMLKLKKISSHIMNIEPVKRQSIISFVSQVLYTFIGFLSTIYFAREVGAGVLGAYFLFITYFSIIDMVSDGGFGGAAVKRISEGEEPNAYFSAFLLLRSFFLVLIVIALVSLREYLVKFDNEGMFIWFLIALVVSLFHGSINIGVYGSGKSGVVATAAFSNNVFRILFQVIAVFLGYEAIGMVGGFIAGLLVATILNLHFFDLKISRFEWRHVDSILRFSFWVFLTSSGFIIFSNVDTLVIGYYLDNENVGIYRVILQFALVASFATTALYSTLWPKVSRWGKTGDTELIEKSLSRAITYSLMFVLPIFSGGLLLGDILLYLFYGAEFSRGYTTLIILLLLQVVNIFQYFFTLYLSALDRAKDSCKVTLIAAMVNIVLDLIFVQLMGIEGAAVATLLSISLNALLAKRILSHLVTIRLERNSLFNILKSVFLMSVFVGISRLLFPLSGVIQTLLLVLLGALIYGTLILKFDYTIREDLKDIGFK